MISREINFLYLHQNQKSDKLGAVCKFLFTGLFKSEKLLFFFFFLNEVIHVPVLYGSYCAFFLCKKMYNSVRCFKTGIATHCIVVLALNW